MRESVTQEDITAGSRTAQEVASQPGCWRHAARLAAGVSGSLPVPGERVAVAGCGTSWFMAQSYAAAREQAGHGETDAFAASEMPAGQRYDRVLVLSRSGTTTEIVQLLGRLAGTVPTVAITAAALSPVAQARRGHRPGLRRRGIRGADQVRHHRAGPAPGAPGARSPARRPTRPSGCWPRRCHPGMLAADQFTFLGTGWTFTGWPTRPR